MNIVDSSEVLTDLCLTPQDYDPEPEQAGQMPDVDRWDKYLSKYMPDSPEQFAINPKAMFFEDRWVLVSRAYGQEFCQELFYRTMEWYVRAVNRQSTMPSA